MGDESNCFVYNVLQDVEVRYASSQEDRFRTGRWFKKGDLVSVDQVLSVDTSSIEFVKNSNSNSQQRDSKDGPFLRLSDGSGWVFESKKGQGVMMAPVLVEKGLWGFYVDNFPVGMALRNHPMDQLKEGCKNILKRIPECALNPMQKLYCDRKVVGNGGVCFYRVQGINPFAWVFDTRIDNSGKVASFTMIPESKIRTGLFAFQAVDKKGVGIRSKCDVGEDTKTGWAVCENEIVVCDLVRESLWTYGNGPFLRLIDGTGWLFVNKRGKKLMEELPIEDGLWKFKVRNSAGIQLRKQPIDATKSRFPTVYKPNEVVHCDRRIQSTVGTTFYRVKGTHGWLFDKRGDVVMMEMIPSGTNDFQQYGQRTTPPGGWTVDFVRGVAMALDDLEEISFQPSNRLISFRHHLEGARINVYYTTRTVGTALDHPSQGKTQLFRRNCTKEELVEILRNPRVHTGHGYYKRTSANKRPRLDVSPQVVSSAGFAVVNKFDEQMHVSGDDEIDLEEDFRNRLVDLEDEMDDLHAKRLTLLKSIRVHEERRAESEAKMEKLQKKHLTLLKKEKQEQGQQELTCKQCGRELGSKTALESHINDVHGSYICGVCGKQCKNKHALNQHIQALGHW